MTTARIDSQISPTFAAGADRNAARHPGVKKRATSLLKNPWGFHGEIQGISWVYHGYIMGISYDIHEDIPIHILYNSPFMGIS